MRKFISSKLLNCIIDPFDNLVFQDTIKYFTTEQTNTVNEFVQMQDKLKIKIAGLINTNLELQNHPVKKVKWLGTQIQFSELLIELEKKNWIEKMEEDTKKDIIRTITMLFDFSSTQKTPDNYKAVNSIIRKLHSSFIPRFNEIFEDYSEVYKDNYTPKFDLIEDNPKF